MEETLAPEINALPTGTKQGIAIVIIKGKLSGEIPSVYLSNRKNSYSFQRKGNFHTQHRKLPTNSVSLKLNSLE